MKGVIDTNNRADMSQRYHTAAVEQAQIDTLLKSREFQWFMEQIGSMKEHALKAALNVLTPMETRNDQAQRHHAFDLVTGFLAARTDANHKILEKKV